MEVPDLVPSLPFFERSLKYYDPEVKAEVRDNREKNRIEFSTVGELACAIEDKCLASSADRNNHSQEIKLLRFSSHTDNFGLLPLYPPVPERYWTWHRCHNHYHSMEVFVSYHLLDTDGNRVAEGHKASFCLEDSSCVNSEDRYFYCDEEQGISVNCGDHYGAELDCQWIDITTVPPGNYKVEVTVNPVKSIMESNYENNVLSCMIELDEDGFYTTDNCLHSGKLYS
ncbi:Lysyl oxidase-like protein 4 [Oopsacas minuta]|uniref:protein-lysine 6-oxidase n=1 Tax=Oopsacas minuta TaxID=111878 RepID=A0AAV7KHB8_9METZ|nr:Lysyl oxidase-like protein 4 [Oopsacas minuta]